MAAVDVDRIKAHARRFFDGFTPGQKSVTILGVVAVLVAAYLFTSWAGTPQYTPLYTGLDAKAAGGVTEELDSRGIPYKLSDGGRTVLVSRKDVYKTRVDLSAKGLPHGSTEGYALLDKGGITKSEFSQRVDYQRALQGELGRTIEAMDGVAAARVTLTIPSETVFVGGEQDRPTAAVLIEPADGRRFGSESVQAIVHLVASSVADMDPDDVTVADSRGNLYAAPGKHGALQAGDQLEQRGSFEQGLSASLERLIAASLGPGRAAVTVHADLDFSTRATTTTEFQQPDDIQLPIRQRSKSETFTGPPSGAGGILGPDGAPLGGDAGTITYSNTDVESENALTTIEQTINQAPGSLQRLSVSVLLDADAVDAGDVAQWESAIAAAAGIDPARNDQLNVARMEFDATAREAAEAEIKGAATEQSKGQLLDIVRHVVTAVIVGLVLFLAWKAIKRAESNRIPLRVPLDLREIEAADMTPIGAGSSRPPDALRPPAEPVALTTEVEVSQLIERQPEEVAQTLRSWLADRRA